MLVRGLFGGGFGGWGCKRVFGIRDGDWGWGSYEIVTIDEGALRLWGRGCIIRIVGGEGEWIWYIF